LRGEDVSPKRHKERFIEFVHLGTPSPKDLKNEIPLFDSRTQKIEMYSFRKLVYAVRWIAIHENDSLDAAQPPDYHIRLDWNMRAPRNGWGSSKTGKSRSMREQ
jgi:hypothetical protein